MKRICAIIVTYNGEPWIKVCLQKLEKSSTRVEVIVVDNNSSDNTVKVVEGFPEVKLFKLSQNLGFGQANNFGLSKSLDSSPDYILLINQDAWVDENVISDLIRIQTSNPDFYILSPLHKSKDGQRVDENFLAYLKNSQDLLEDLLLKEKTREIHEVPFLNAAIWLMPIECVNLVGGFDSLFPHYGEDNDYANRVKYFKKKIGVCPSLTGYHDRKVSSFRTSQKKIAINKVACLYLLKNINKNLSYCFFKCFAMLTRTSIQAIKDKEPRLIFQYFKNFIACLMKMKTIISHRKTSRIAGRSFLPFA